MINGPVRGTINTRHDQHADRFAARKGRGVLFQVILSTEHDRVHEFDLDAPDACTAAWLAGGEIRDQHPETIVTNVHARRVHNGVEHE